MNESEKMALMELVESNFEEFVQLARNYMSRAECANLCDKLRVDISNGELDDNWGDE